MLDGLDVNDEFFADPLEARVAVLVEARAELFPELRAAAVCAATVRLRDVLEPARPLAPRARRCVTGPIFRGSVTASVRPALTLADDR